MEDIFDYEHLEEAFFKCRKNVSWKPSVKDFTINNSECLLKMANQIHDGTWENGKPRKILGFISADKRFKEEIEKIVA